MRVEAVVTSAAVLLGSAYLLAGVDLLDVSIGSVNVGPYIGVGFALTAALTLYHVLDREYEIRGELRR